MNIDTLSPLRSDTSNKTERAEVLFNQHKHEIYVRTDRLFAALMLVQWIVSFIFAIFLAPNAYAKVPASQHVYAALFVGGFLTLVPCFLIWRMPGSVITRHVIAIGQLAMSGLLIHLSGGRIETHFHIFGSMAFLTFYRDWRVVVTGTVVTALDHLFRGMFIPESIFGVNAIVEGHAHAMTAHIGRVIEHASYVVFEDIILVISCLTNLKEMRDVAAKQVEVELANHELEYEKNSIQQKIEVAVRESEVQKRYLSESVSEMLEKMDQFAVGDLQVRLDTEKKGDIGRLFVGFNQAVENTGRLLREVTEAVNTVADAAYQINSSTEDLDTATQQQSAQTMEATAAFGQMSAASAETAKLGRLTAQAATESGDSAKQGELIVSQSTSKMSRIAEVVRTSAQTVEELGNSSEEIGKIVSVIDDIADRTNLLALNAAIEAARAGQHGLGFAVVADEVRQLAERTRTATSQIYDMISAVQTETNRAVQAMAVGTEEVDAGIALSQRTADALNQIVEKTQGMIDRVNQIAAVSEQQAVANVRVSENVQIISNATVRSAEGVSQIANAANRLNQLTGLLRSLTTRFKLDPAQSGEANAWSEPRLVQELEPELVAH